MDDVYAIENHKFMMEMDMMITYSMRMILLWTLEGAYRSQKYDTANYFL